MSALVKCRMCGETKPTEDFAPANITTIGTGRCRVCTNRALAEWKQKNPEAVAAKAARRKAEWREKHPIKHRPPLLTPEGRLCRTCGIRKQPEDFHRDAKSKDRRAWRCKSCTSLALHKWKGENRPRYLDIARGVARRYLERHPERARLAVRKQRVKRAYGMTLEEVDALFATQGGGCKICGKTLRLPNGQKIPASERAHIDHCHVSLKVRGILCAGCNTGLGSFKDDPDLMQKAILYLRA